MNLNITGRIVRTQGNYTAATIDDYDFELECFGQRANIAAARNRGTILLVDDDESIRRLVRSILADHQYHLIEAGDGAEALKVATAHEGPIDLLLTDVIMPKLNGILLAERMLQHRPRMAVLFMSGYIESALLSPTLPDVPVLQKPFEADRLIDAVHAVLGSTLEP
jgi:DNA-binding NtrC family response regulator